VCEHHNYDSHAREIIIRNIDSNNVIRTAKYNGYYGELVISPNGGTIAYIINRTNLKIFNIKTGHCIDGNVSCEGSLSFSPNNKFIAASYGQNYIKIFDAKTGNCIKSINVFKSDIIRIEYHGIFSTSFSPDNNSIVIGTLDGIVKILDINSDRVSNIKEQSGEIISVMFFKDGKTIIANTNYEIKIFNVYSGKCINTIYSEFNYQNVVLLDNRTFAYINYDNIEILDINSKQPIKKFNIGCCITAIISSDDSKLIICGLENGVIRVIDIESGSYIQLIGHTGSIHSILFSSNKKIIVSYSADETIRKWYI
jgi:WD40 repeat protein